MVISLAQRGNRPVAPALRLTQFDKQHLIGIVMNRLPQLRLQCHPLNRAQIALENRIQEMIPVS